MPAAPPPKPEVDLDPPEPGSTDGIAIDTHDHVAGDETKEAPKTDKPS